ncbi:MAG: hypothetical protein AAFP22_07445 [Planctomycetota bacterium]
MSRLIDLALLVGVGLLGWWLLSARPGGASDVVPITTTVQVRGNESLKGLGILLVPEDERAAAVASASDDIAPHQLSPWQANRRTQVLVPAPGSYLVRWGVQTDKPPRRARDVMHELEPTEKIEDQRIVVPSGASTRDVFEVELPAVHAAGLRRVAEGG